MQKPRPAILMMIRSNCSFTWMWSTYNKYLFFSDGKSTRDWPLDIGHLTWGKCATATLKAVPVSTGQLFPSIAENDSFCTLNLVTWRTGSPPGRDAIWRGRWRRRDICQNPNHRGGGGNNPQIGLFQFLFSYFIFHCFADFIQALGLLAEREQQLAMTMIMMPGGEGEVVCVRRGRTNSFLLCFYSMMFHGNRDVVSINGRHQLLPIGLQDDGRTAQHNTGNKNICQTIKTF